MKFEYFTILSIGKRLICPLDKYGHGSHNNKISLKPFQLAFIVARDSKKLSLHQLSKALGISKRIIEKWESGDKSPPKWRQQLILDSIYKLNTGGQQ